MRLKTLLKSKKQDIVTTAARYGVSNIRVFGSVARGEEDENSDIDFLVDMEPGRSLLDLGGFLVELQDILGHPVDVVTVNGLKERIRDKVMNEAVGL